MMMIKCSKTSQQKKNKTINMWIDSTTVKKVEVQMARKIYKGQNFFSSLKRLHFKTSQIIPSKTSCPVKEMPFCKLPSSVKQ